MSFLPLIFTTLLYLFYGQAQLCSSRIDSTDLLQSGFFILTNFQQNLRQHCFSAIPISFNGQNYNQNIQSVVSTADIIQINTAFGFDYIIRSKVDSNTLKIFLLINQDQSWKLIKTCYLISARSQFRLGSFNANEIEWFSCKNDSMNNYLNSRYVIPGWKGSSSKYQFIYLISGLQIKSGFQKISILQADLNSNNGQIQIKLQTIINSTIQHIQISYIVFQQSEYFFAFSYSTQNYDLNSFNGYFFQGANGFQSNFVLYEGYAFQKKQLLPCVGSSCTQNCVSMQNCYNNKGYVFLSNCYFCQDNQTFANGTCIYNNYQQNCLTNQYFNGSTCICLQNYTKINGVCQIICPSLTYFNGTQCTCIPGYAKISGQCLLQCPVNSYINSDYVCLCNDGFALGPLGQCIQVSCQINEYFNLSLSTCLCKPGFLKYNQICTQRCPGNIQNAVIFNGVCICIQNYTVINGFCVFTRPNCTKAHQIKVNNTCQCQINYSYNSTKDCVPSCKQNFTLNTNGECVCASNYVLVGNSCYQICNVNGYKFASLCLCKPGFQFINNVCTSICQPSQYFNAATNLCTCSGGYGKINSQVCIICPNNSFINSSGYCNCNSNYYMSPSNQCIVNVSCPSNSVYNITSNTCVCSSARLYLINGVCQPCPNNSTWSGSNCICNGGFYRSGSTCSACYFSCGTCTNNLRSGCLSCINSYVLLNGQCFKLA